MKPSRRRASTSAPFCRSLTCVASFLGVHAVDSSALADPLAQLNLQWQAPAPCPDVAFLQTQLRRDLEGSQSPGEALVVRAIVDRGEGDEWRVSIHAQSAAGESDRLLAARSCDALADATSLIVAMQIDPETAAIHARVIDGLSEPVAALPQSTAPSNVPRVAYPGQLLPAAVTPTRRVAAASGTKTIEKDLGAHNVASGVLRPRVRGLVSVSVQRDWGSLPVASEIFSGALGAAYGRWWGELSVGVSPREDIAQPAAPVIGSVRLLTAELRACRQLWARSAVSLSPCVGFEWAKWSSDGEPSLSAERADSALTSAVTLRWIATIRIFENLSLIVPIDALVPLSRPRFGFVDTAERQVVVFEPSWIALRAGAGVQLHFP